MRNRASKSDDHVYMREWTQTWADRLFALVDFSYMAIAAADLFSKLPLLSKLLPAETLKDDRKKDA